MRIITSGRLLLRPWQADDADFLFDMESRWEVVRFLGPNPRTLRMREEALASIRHRREVDHPIHGIWAITTRDGSLVGNLALVPIPLSAGQPAVTPPEVEIGWHLHPHAWGIGYATEAARAVMDDAFAQGLTRIIAVTNVGHEPSQAVCRRLGMAHLGQTTRYYDTTKELFEKLPVDHLAALAAHP
ncbi:GNAT family N-acetyltransferase [Micromonospora sp. CPCC 205539]|uniref:GNAT family N-acetyltransferase n=1 Tax=Micromonospora sp. CPCC 205539 TaxID=3122408 RepID=UPI002FEEE667